MRSLITATKSSPRSPQRKPKYSNIDPAQPKKKRPVLDKVDSPREERR